ncbi:hypothetical protein BaRGS_00003549 [Batillaria attramentaria]|uniref:Uncharacterized protein n=1 Tax=Batillaria attramentaria TaxID=370345 RepID=A0ABD0M1A2_9CAEN
MTTDESVTSRSPALARTEIVEGDSVSHMSAKRTDTTAESTGKAAPPLRWLFIGSISSLSLFTLRSGQVWVLRPFGHWPVQVMAGSVHVQYKHIDRHKILVLAMYGLGLTTDLRLLIRPSTNQKLRLCSKVILAGSGNDGKAECRTH